MNFDNYELGPFYDEMFEAPPDWQNWFISAYASAHSWEDEKFAFVHRVVRDFNVPLFLETCRHIVLTASPWPDQTMPIDGNFRGSGTTSTITHDIRMQTA